MDYKIVSKFIKDISFEIPDAQTFLLLEKEISKYTLNFDIKSLPVKNNVIEVNTILRLTPNQDVKHKILTEINFATLISIDKSSGDKKELEKIILSKIPAEIYPTLYETFVYLFSKAGIKNISIEKEVNFEKMYAEREKKSSPESLISEKTKS
jgi:preprotein translocase subunit SecB